MISPFIRDTLAKRLALTILLAVFSSIGLYLLFVKAGGVWARPSIAETGLEEQAATLVRVIGALPQALRPAASQAAGNDVFQVEWHRSIPSIHQNLALEAVRMEHLIHARTPGCRVLVYQAPAASDRRSDNDLFGTAAYGMAVSLPDATWLVFTAQHRSWGVRPWFRYSLILFFVLISTVTISWLASRTLIQPFEAFTSAARRFGTDPNAPPMPEKGPIELHAAIAAFNSMQTQIRRFVTDRTDMLAAISHDLRTPLTRVRLRGEFIDDLDQRQRLFRDVDEMQAMIHAALAFFNDEAPTEYSTQFVISDLLQIIVDDLTDQGRNAKIEGSDHFIFEGRPIALKRAFGNLIENACLYGEEARVSIEADHNNMMVFIRDKGPGIPESSIEEVFLPFYRVERSRNRKTGGIGLGLTSARAIVTAHGGEIILKNHADGGLLVTVALPFPT
ncbi:MAG: ATP-binding protein [Acetobacter sp.]|jgi:signal transduction histidine kinase|uniref:ATP-binding protein n=1 Tax=Acetobacter fabarum TaxID=483199 RepID=UPI00242DC8BD|nr:ATP-binding protein [Acetobacter fabarum]MCH4024789.1 ATP-binding protein [Acetobacter fabarum]MCH4059872.1 ATP-binding protein [Acetobacter sp.]MCH4086813.1 ATP-binding protein [Acetobacter sp.]